MQEYFLGDVAFGNDIFLLISFEKGQQGGMLMWIMIVIVIVIVMVWIAVAVFCHFKVFNSSSII